MRSGNYFYIWSYGLYICNQGFLSNPIRNCQNYYFCSFNKHLFHNLRFSWVAINNQNPLVFKIVYNLLVIINYYKRNLILFKNFAYPAPYSAKTADNNMVFQIF